MQNRTTFYLLIILLVSSMTLPAGTGHLVHKLANGPVIHSGSSGSWDAAGVSSPKVIFHDGTYHLWYTGTNYVGQMAIGYATSKDGIEWQEYEYNPVLKPGANGEWDAALAGGAEVIFHNGKFHMWYNGARELPMDDGPLVAIGYATSRDGIHWSKSEDNPCIREVFASGMKKVTVYAPSVIRDQNEFRIWYTAMVKGQTGINTAASRDGTDWQMSPLNPVIRADNWKVDFIGAPAVVTRANGYSMYLTTMINDNSEIRYASSEDGTIWTKNISETVLCADKCFSHKETRVSNGAVVLNNGIFKFWYSGQIDGKWQICYAEDFEAVPHVNSLECDNTFHSPIENPNDVLHLKAVVHNPGSRNVDVFACIKKLDGSEVASFALTQAEGDLWQGSWPIPEVNETYQVIVTAGCNETGTQNCSGFWAPSRFTTVGPLKIQEFELKTTKMNEKELRLKLLSQARDEIARVVTARITPLDPEMVKNIHGEQVFGNIDPGSTRESSTITYIEINERYQDNTDRIPVTVHVDYDGFEMMAFDIMLTATSLESMEQNIATRFELTQNYPNPFNPATTINFSLPSAQNVVLNIYNVLGAHVATLVNEPLNHGTYSYLWHAGNLPSGIYYYQLLAGPYSQVRKMILVK